MSLTWLMPMLKHSTRQKEAELAYTMLAQEKVINPLNTLFLMKNKYYHIVYHSLGLKLTTFIRSHWSGRSVKEFVEACKKATGVDIKVDYFPRRPGDYAEVYSDPAKINRELNWTAQHTDLHESLRVAWTWQKAHRSGYEPPQAMIL